MSCVTRGAQRDLEDTSRHCQLTALSRTCSSVILASLALFSWFWWVLGLSAPGLKELLAAGGGGWCRGSTEWFLLWPFSREKGNKRQSLCVLLWAES